MSSLVELGDLAECELVASSLVELATFLLTALVELRASSTDYAICVVIVIRARSARLSP